MRIVSRAVISQKRVHSILEDLAVRLSGRVGPVVARSTADRDVYGSILHWSDVNFSGHKE